jgi:hypothetical protein
MMMLMMMMMMILLITEVLFRQSTADLHSNTTVNVNTTVNASASASASTEMRMEKRAAVIECDLIPLALRRSQMCLPKTAQALPRRRRCRLLVTTVSMYLA